ncbi:DUF1871 family protein [Cytobacillus purgationiresistens]|uniref:DUF1871 domain-containing protein n=1 Tax=Cytobacillus purgationiresistens TaxID=863449 RepID=A0ABU0AI11_9BACI|nr:DUF1871 family protein [Cytobacillus purgationiresistens]MDQ0270896.1 hypothetical protein [Cytobacillus purgationiresistens]
MDTQQTNLMLVDTLNEWDPFDIGGGNYDTEIADTIQFLHDLDDADKLSRKIQSIYEFSFEEMIPLQQCKLIANRLLLIKNNSSCSL